LLAPARKDKATAMLAVGALGWQVSAMPFADRITRTPLAYDREGTGDIAARFAGADPALRAVLTGTAGCSPHLSGLIRREADWLDAAFDAGPEHACAGLLDTIVALPPDAVGPGLRRVKARAALLIALSDIAGVWSLEQTTGALTDLADAAVARALETLVADEIRRGRIPGATEDDAAAGAGLFVVAMGKMGARELNYSSDIDLICLFDETRFDRGDAGEARGAFVRIVRRMAGLLSDNTPDGYVFRTDLRLRPDASVTPVCISAGAAEQYYEAQGRTWERAAYIKARIAAGDRAAGARFLTALTPFVWRRHLDFAAIRDAHDMRLRIRDHKRLHGPVSLPGHDLKLGQGGIREIEFFTQTRQLIAGGRDPDLRDRTTVGGLAALAAKGWVPADVAADLTADYCAHREVEHRLQMLNDAQTHDLPGSQEGLDRLARLSGEGNTARYLDAIAGRIARVSDRTEGFFNPGERAPDVDLDPETRAMVDGWMHYPALRSERAAALFRRLLPDLMRRMQRAANPREALARFDSFLAGLPAGVQLFSLFDANPQLVDLIVDICATAPGLAVYLGRNAGVLDAVIGGDFFAPWPGPGALAAALTRAMEASTDYERKLDAARVWAKEWHFRIGVHHLRALVDAETAGRHYADLAGAVVAAVWPLVLDEFAIRHGPPPGNGAAVLGMGSLGAGRLNAGSDLDLIVIYDAPGDALSDGARPLAARTYFARLTQALVTALTAPMQHGRLYEVDMRLRPSGRQGPVATSLSGFRDYQMNEAWTWEHLALTRALPIAGPAALCEAVETARREVLSAKAAGPSVVADTADMRRRIFAARSPDGAWEAKIGPGRIQDVELFAQNLALRSGSPARRVDAQLASGRKAGLIGVDEEEALRRALRFLWSLHAGARLLTDRPLDLKAVGEGGQVFLLRETGASSVDDMAERLATAAATAASIVENRLDAADGPTTSSA
jgi:glutamate-ammonia-ligase adenylyltransferase